MFAGIAQKLGGIHHLDLALEIALTSPQSDSIFTRLRKSIGFQIQIGKGSTKRIPTKGPLLVVANHPTGFAEGIAIPALMDAYRPDVTVMAHVFFSRWPELAKRMILVDPQSQGAANADGFKAAAKALLRGESVIMFPAAEVARPHRPFLAPEELKWKTGVARLARLTGATILPIHVSGRPGLAYRILSWIHPRLGTLLLCRELFTWRGKSMVITVGAPFSITELGDEVSHAYTASRCRERVLELGVAKSATSFRDPAAYGKLHSAKMDNPTPVT